LRSSFCFLDQLSHNFCFECVALQVVVGSSSY
jgi:hypothetical protein